MSIPPLRWWSQLHLWLCALRCTGEGTARENLRCCVGELPGPLSEKLVHFFVARGDALLLLLLVSTCNINIVSSLHVVFG